MTKERIVKPVVHQHLEKIEDHIVVDAIASNMGKFRDNEGAAYDHETGRSDHSAMRSIAEACANVYEEGMDHESVWQTAQEQCTDAAIGLGWDYARELKETGISNETTRKKIRSNVSAALSMFALDYQMGRAPSVAKSEEDTTPDILFDTDLPKVVRDALASEVRYMREHGIVADDGDHTPVAVADIITERPRELHYEVWRGNMEKAFNEIPEEQDQYAKYQDRIAISRTQDALEAIAYEYDPQVLREPCEQTLEFVRDYYGDNTNMAVAVLHNIPDAYVAGLYGQETEAAQIFENILQRASDSDYVIEGHTLWKLHSYLPGGLTGEVARQHPVIKKLREQYSDDTSFLSAALPEMPSLEHPEAAPTYNRHMREMMTEICVSLFPEPWPAFLYAQDMIRSFEPRLFTTNDVTGYAAYENSDQHETMQVIINRLNRRVKKYGAGRFMELANTFDLGAIDVFSDRDIEVLDALERGDPTEIATLRQQDVTLVMFDAYGDHNGAMKHIADQLNIRDKNHERILVTWRHLPDFHETLAMLRRHGIKPCTIAVANHGDPGVMLFNKGPESFQIVSDMSVARSLPGVNRPYDMNYSQLETIARHFMSEPRYASPRRQPKKRWILASCASDSAPEEDIPSVAEKGIRMINQSDISVIATEDYSTVFDGENSKGLHMAGSRSGETSEHRREPRTSNMVELSIDPTAAWITVERKPVETRITT